MAVIGDTYLTEEPQYEMDQELYDQDVANGIAEHPLSDRYKKFVGNVTIVNFWNGISWLQWTQTNDPVNVYIKEG